MAKLNEAVQRFIVQALACYDTPTQVAESVKEDFGIEVTRQQIASYDPTKAASKNNLAKKWRDLFADNRGYVLAARGDLSSNNNTYGSGALPADESAWRTYEVNLSKRGNGSDWESGDKVYQILIPFATPSISNAVFEIDWVVVGERIVVDENISV